MSQAPALEPEFLDPLLDLLRIPSVSTGAGNPDAIREAAGWMRDFVTASGGSCEIVETAGNPLVVGRFDASSPDAPTVLIYGHYDVQGAEPVGEWTTPPFEPDIREGRIYARGASDDKGNFWPLVYEAAQMARAGELRVNVRVLVEGEEERGSTNVLRWLADDPEGADACIIYDSGSIGRNATITLGGRGIVTGYVNVRTAERDLHSGVYGGTVPNPLHVLMHMLEAAVAGPDGRLPDELRTGISAIPAAERAAWAEIPAGERVFTRVGGRPLHADAGDRYFEITGWEPSFDVNEIKAGDPRTVIPARARAFVSVRLAPGQKHAEIRSALERMLKERAHPQADVTFEWEGGVDAAGFDPTSPPLQAARRAFERAFDGEPVLVRMGGTLPLLDVLAKRKIPTIFTGFAGPGDQIHAPDESYSLEALDRGRRGARALLEELSSL